MSSVSAIIFAECHGPSCVCVRGIWYTALFRVSLRGVRLRCVGLAQKISVRCKRASNTGSCGFSFSLICIFILSLALSYMYVFFLILSAPTSDLESRLWKVNIDQKWNLFHHYLFQRTPVIYDVISQENVFLFAIYFHLNMKLGRDKFFCFVTQKLFAATSVEKSRAITPEKFAFSFLAIEGESMQWSVLRPL